jgi:hypothetical protein
VVQDDIWGLSTALPALRGVPLGTVSQASIKQAIRASAALTILAAVVWSATTYESPARIAKQLRHQLEHLHAAIDALVWHTQARGLPTYGQPPSYHDMGFAIVPSPPADVRGEGSASKDSMHCRASAHLPEPPKASGRLDAMPTAARPTRAGEGVPWGLASRFAPPTPAMQATGHWPHTYAPAMQGGFPALPFSLPGNITTRAHAWRPTLPLEHGGTIPHPHPAARNAQGQIASLAAVPGGPGLLTTTPELVHRGVQLGGASEQPGTMRSSRGRQDRGSEGPAVFNPEAPSAVDEGVSAGGLQRSPRGAEPRRRKRPAAAGEESCDTPMQQKPRRVK